MTYTQELEKALDNIGGITEPPRAMEMFAWQDWQVDALRVVLDAARKYLAELT